MGAEAPDTGEPTARARIEPALDERFLRRALELSRDGIGEVWPNPSVGCVVVNGGQVVGGARTARGGRPHAETLALTLAGAAAAGSTLYVTLEPCSHWGKTPPCAEAVLASQVARVVAAVLDPDPRVNGAGLQLLRSNGVAVDHGLLAAEACVINAGFFHRIATGRPLVEVLPGGGSSSLEGPGSVRALRPDAWLEPEPSDDWTGCVVRAHHGARGTRVELELGDGSIEHLGEVALLRTESDVRGILELLGQRGLTRLAVGENHPLLSPLLQHGLCAGRSPTKESRGAGPTR